MTHNYLVCVSIITPNTLITNPFGPSVGREVYDLCFRQNTHLYLQPSTFNSLMTLINSSRVPSYKVLPFEKVDRLEGDKVVAESFTSNLDVGSIFPSNPLVFTRCCLAIGIAISSPSSNHL